MGLAALGLAALGVREGDLPGPNHAETLPGELLEVFGVLDALDLFLQIVPLLLQGLDPLLELDDRVPLGQVVPDWTRSGDAQDEQDRHEHDRPGRDSAPGRGTGLRASAQRANLRYGAAPT